MGDYVTLLGAESVQRAGSTIRSAAGTMQQAANNMYDAFDRHQRFLDDWLARFEAVVDKLVKQVEE